MASSSHTNSAPTLGGCASDNQEAHIGNVLLIKTSVSVTVVRTQIQLADVLNLTPGVVLSFDKPITEPLELESSGQVVGKVEAVKLGDHLGFRVA